MRVNYAAYTAGQLAEFDVAQGDASACAGVLADIARTSADKTLRADARHRLQSEPDSGAVDEGDFSKFVWMFGGEKCGGAKLDIPRISKRSVAISY